MITAALCLALLPCSKKVVGLIPLHLLCGVHMFSWCHWWLLSWYCRFLPQSSRWSVRKTVVCLSMNWWHVQVVTLPSPQDSCDRLQLPCDPECSRNGDEGWMDGQFQAISWRQYTAHNHVAHPLSYENWPVPEMKDFFSTTLTVGKATEIMWMLSGSLCIIPLYYEQIYCRLLAKRHQRRSNDVNQREAHWTAFLCRSCLRIKIRLSYDSEEVRSLTPIHLTHEVNQIHSSVLLGPPRRLLALSCAKSMSITDHILSFPDV